MTQQRPHISVCICTYKRPELLRRLLEDLQHQDTGDLFTYSIVVVENGDSEGAEAVVSEFAGSGTSIVYCREPRQNIALARNKAMANAAGDFIAFIDDDEFPTKHWLLTMLQCCQKFEAAGVLGPVFSHFDKNAPKWVVKGGLFDRPRHPTGMRLNSAQTRTGNVLMKKEILAGEVQPFDPEFLAASDQVFFKKMMNKGHVFVWCDEGFVHEVVPPARWKRSFLIRRALFRGVFSKRLVGSSPLPFATSMVAAFGLAVLLPVSVLFGQTTSMKCAYKLCYHVGRLLGLLGINPIKTPYVTE